MRSRGWRLSSVVVAVGLVLLVRAGWEAAPARSASSSLLITAVYYDTYLLDEPDEAFRLMNVSSTAVDLSGWTVTDGPNEGTISLQGSLAPGASIWIARQAAGFALEFGFSPAHEYGADTDPSVPNLTMSGTVALANTGDQLILKDGEVIVDSVVWEGGDPAGTGWSGPTIWPYGGDSTGTEGFARLDRTVEGFGFEGQILYRKLDQATARPVPDTDTAADWAQATDDNINGKKV
ncbi:MAG: lamin tail domain-containing protein, partial [Anaerolineae bacterium]